MEPLRYPVKGQFFGLNNQRIYPEAKSLNFKAIDERYAIVAVTNQSRIEQGYKSPEDADRKFEQLNLEDFFAT